MPVPAIFYAHRCESPPRSTNQVGRFYHMTFQNGGHDRGKWPGRSLGMKLKCQIATVGVKNRPVCPHQSMAKLARDFRWRSNSLRSVYKIARCVAGFIRRSRRSAKIAIAVPGTPSDFRRSPRSAYKIARCVAGLLISCLLISLSRLSYAQLEQAKLERSFFKESLL